MIARGFAVVIASFLLMFLTLSLLLTRGSPLMMLESYEIYPSANNMNAEVIDKYSHRISRRGARRYYATVKFDDGIEEVRITSSEFLEVSVGDTGTFHHSEKIEIILSDGSGRYSTFISDASADAESILKSNLNKEVRRGELIKALKTSQ